jgi:hypothetical protein
MKYPICIVPCRPDNTKTQHTGQANPAGIHIIPEGSLGQEFRWKTARQSTTGVNSLKADTSSSGFTKAGCSFPHYEPP